MNARRDFLRRSGALVVGFTLLPGALAQGEGGEGGGAAKPKAGPKRPGSLDKDPYLDAWIRVDSEGRVTVCTGKAELGQGIKTAILQIAAEELDVDYRAIHLVTADTALTPNEGFTAGSHSLQDSGTAIRHAAAQVRAILLAEAAKRWSVPVEQLGVSEGVGSGPAAGTPGTASSSRRARCTWRPSRNRSSRRRATSASWTGRCSAWTFPRR